MGFQLLGFYCEFQDWRAKAKAVEADHEGAVRHVNSLLVPNELDLGRLNHVNSVLVSNELGLRL